MSTTLEALEAEVLGLPPEDRSRLLDRLIESLDDENSLDEAWDKEAARRDEEIETGAAVAVDGKEAVERLRASSSGTKEEGRTMGASGAEVLATRLNLNSDVPTHHA